MTEQLIDDSIFQNTGKYNTSVKLTEEDKRNRVKVFCKEDYAQELYDAMIAYDKSSGRTLMGKDLVDGTVYTVTAKNISYTDNNILAEEVNTKCTVTIPFKEYSKPLETLVTNEQQRTFLVIVYKSSGHGEFFASEKKALSISYKKELFNHLKDNTWFDVKITKLIKGGYLAIYKNEIACFIPGSHAAANVVRDFSELLGKTLTVMVDNYDAANNLFILSYKKYVTNSMPTMISELHFDKEYVGTLTNRPYEFGVFVEFEGYYTGLVHKSEFKNYDEICKTMKSGDKLNVYVKDVTTKGTQYRVVLTLNKDQVSNDKLQWQSLRNRTENHCFNYSVSDNKSSISIDIDGENFEVSLRRKDLEKNLTRYPLVKVFKVDPINKRLKFEFVESAELVQ